MSEHSKPDFDFDEWANLAETDPEAFEARRKALIESTIDQAPEARQHRLRCLQWKIDQVRTVSRTPMGACVRISRMMWDSVMGPNGLLESLERLGEVSRGGDLPQGPTTTAKILPLSSSTVQSSETGSSRGHQTV